MFVWQEEDGSPSLIFILHSYSFTQSIIVHWEWHHHNSCSACYPATHEKCQVESLWTCVSRRDYIIRLLWHFGISQNGSDGDAETKIFSFIWRWQDKLIVHGDNLFLDDLIFEEDPIADNTGFERELHWFLKAFVIQQ